MKKTIRYSSHFKKSVKKKEKEKCLELISEIESTLKGTSPTELEMKIGAQTYTKEEFVNKFNDEFMRTQVEVSRKAVNDILNREINKPFTTPESEINDAYGIIDRLPNKEEYLLLSKEKTNSSLKLPRPKGGKSQEKRNDKDNKESKKTNRALKATAILVIISLLIIRLLPAIERVNEDLKVVEYFETSKGNYVNNSMIYNMVYSSNSMIKELEAMTKLLAKTESTSEAKQNSDFFTKEARARSFDIESVQLIEKDISTNGEELYKAYLDEISTFDITEQKAVLHVNTENWVAVYTVNLEEFKNTILTQSRDCNTYVQSQEGENGSTILGMNKISKYSVDTIKYNRSSAPIIVVDNKYAVTDYSTVYKGKHLLIDTGIFKFYILTEREDDKVAIFNDEDLKSNVILESQEDIQ